MTVNLPPIRALIGQYRKRRELRRFFASPYEQRVATIKRLYEHSAKKKESFARFFASRDSDLTGTPQPFYDLILAYVQLIEPPMVLQIGCFGASESRWLIEHDVQSRILASDFDRERLEWLRNHFVGSRYEKIEFQVIDLERAQPGHI